jgi:hypothetical protein
VHRSHVAPGYVGGMSLPVPVAVLLLLLYVTVPLALGFWLQRRSARRAAPSAPASPASAPPMSAEAEAEASAEAALRWFGAVGIRSDGGHLHIEVRRASVSRIPFGWSRVWATDETLHFGYGPASASVTLTVRVPPADGRAVAGALDSTYPPRLPLPVEDVSAETIRAAPEAWAGRVVRVRGGWTWYRCHDWAACHIEGLPLRFAEEAPCPPRVRGSSEPEPPPQPVVATGLVVYEPSADEHPWAPPPLRLLTFHLYETAS